MKFLHTADLHIGKTVHEFSMLEEQKHVLLQMIEIAQQEKVDAVLLAGDVYDRAVPSAEAVLLLDWFLTKLLAEKIAIYIIAGNHDSPERLAFANQILEKQGLIIAGALEEKAKTILVEDAYGSIQIDLLPFIKPAAWGVKTTQEALQCVQKTITQPKDKKTRRVCLAHFFVTDAGRKPELSDSESGVYVGGLDNVEAYCFEEYDYVALGHIHKAQQIGERPFYYSGSPVKYSFSEAHGNKSIQLVTLAEKGMVTIERVYLKPIHDMRKIKGTLQQLTEKTIVGSADANDYIQATLTDEGELMDPIGTLRSVYPNICQIILDKKYQEKEEGYKVPNRATKEKGIYTLFSDFYETVTGNEMDEERKEAVLAMIKETQA